MISNPSSRIPTLAILCVLVLAAAAPAAAVTVDETDVPTEAEAGSQITASVTLTDLYLEPNWDPWTLRGQTELTNVTWSVTFIDATGNEFDTQSFDGQQLNDGNGVRISTENDVDRVRVELVGEVPEPDAFTYPEKESFLVADLTQTRSEEGSRANIDAWNAHHYTTGTEMEPGSREARQALSRAEGAIVDAESVDADVSDANETLQSAKQFYELGQFQNAVDRANRAEGQADEAKAAAENSRETTQLLMYAGAAVLLLALLGGGYWYYQQQQDSYDKLG